MSSTDAENGSLLGRMGFLASTLTIVFIFIVITWEVITRYLVGDSSMWVTEVAGYLLAGALFLGMGRVYRVDGHVRMSVLIDAVSPKKANVLLLISDAVVLVFAIVMLWQTWSLTIDSYMFNWRSSTNLEVRLYLPQALMTFGALIFLVEVFLTAYKRIQSVNKN